MVEATFEQAYPIAARAARVRATAAVVSGAIPDGRPGGLRTGGADRLLARPPPIRSGSGIAPDLHRASHRQPHCLFGARRPAVACARATECSRSAASRFRGGRPGTLSPTSSGSHRRSNATTGS